MREKYIYDAFVSAFLDYDNQKLVKIISWTSRGESTDNERKQIYDALKSIEITKNPDYWRLQKWIIDVIFQYWTAKNIEASGLGSALKVKTLCTENNKKFILKN